ncbi:MAG: lipoate--protein ligase family protein [Elainellaceae cyanobacterium]
MALDEWLLDQHRSGLHPPTLRFYQWSPPAISLGYHQRHWCDAWAALTWNGCAIDLVRRPTGGRAVLHQGDITYALIASDIHGSRVEVYQTLCQFLISGMRSLGVELHYGDAGKGYIHNPNCFGTSTSADLVLADRTKLIGSAQLRRGSAILQHGSIRLNPDPQLYEHVFGTPLDLPSLPHSLCDLSAERRYERIIQALTEAAQECYGICFVNQPLSEDEWQTIKGRSPRWNVVTAHP